MRISIVGAGVAGLAAAGLLAADGHDVDVFEATGAVRTPTGPHRFTFAEMEGKVEMTEAQVQAASITLEASRPASVFCRMRATSVEPVNITPCTRASPTSDAPTVSPRPGSNCTAARGTPACHSTRTASAATRLFIRATSRAAASRAMEASLIARSSVATSSPPPSVEEMLASVCPRRTLLPEA